MTVPTVSNQWQTNSGCSIRQTRSLLLPTQAYNRRHGMAYKVYLGNITKANADVRGARSFAPCVSLVILSNSPRMSVVCMSVSACVCLYKYRHLYVTVRWAVTLHTLTLIRSEVKSLKCIALCRVAALSTCGFVSSHSRLYLPSKRSDYSGY